MMTLRHQNNTRTTTTPHALAQQISHRWPQRTQDAAANFHLVQRSHCKKPSSFHINSPLGQWAEPCGNHENCIANDGLVGTSADRAVPSPLHVLLSMLSTHRSMKNDEHVLFLALLRRRCASRTKFDKFGIPMMKTRGYLHKCQQRARPPAAIATRQ